MTNDDVLFLAKMLPLVDAPDMGAKFNYAISKTLRKAESESKDILKAIEPDEDYKKYQKEYTALQRQSSRKDDEGNPVMGQRNVNGMIQPFFDIPGINDPQSNWSKSVEKLKEKFKTAIDRHDEKMKFLDEENTSFQPHMIDLDIVPKGLSRRAMDAVYLMVKEPEPEKKEPKKEKS